MIKRRFFGCRIDLRGHELSPRDSCKIAGQGAKGAAAEFSQKPAVILEEDPEHPGDSEDNLAVGDIQKKLLSHPLAPLLSFPTEISRRPPGKTSETENKGADFMKSGKRRPCVGAGPAKVNHRISP